ncbi:cyanophycin synthetase [Flavobacterium sinopsychrotolerans]|uniref:Cyanophycin synthetase n=1 Tax=Flavobacterium sinopsychrotolerans TaxID=604089 RepID=A0A1H8LCM4_9FLAO|nr:cyanophycin synthetase [Flavobacterium sinopsychrotolerans]SEO02895.1 cyanophycin synthetase [Flavobacterium sinopsychrotolerans]
MEIIEIKVMRGANYWSGNREKLIVMKLDIGDWEQRPTNTINGFGGALERLMPSLKSHRCSQGVEGGFLEHVRIGTWLGHVIEHIALELQSLAGMECGFGRTRSTNVKGIYHVVFSYSTERAGKYAAKAAVDLVENLLIGLDYNLDVAIQELQRLYNSEKLGPSTFAIVKEAQSRNIPYTRLNNDSLLMLGQGRSQKIIRASVASTTSSIAVDLASDKDATRNLLSRSYIPVPKGMLIDDINELEEAVKNIGFPLVTKPVNGNHGRGITTQITTLDQARKGFYAAQKISEDVIIERFIPGNDYRFLVINYKLAAVAKRTPALVTGNGRSTIEELIHETNSDPKRGEGHQKVLTKISIDAATLSILAAKELRLDSVLSIGEILFLKDTANLSSGGTATDVTDMVHPQNIFMAERIARLMNLDICGIDIMAEDVAGSITQENGAVIEVNAGPGLRMHLSPTEGTPRNVVAPLVDMLFPNNASGRIPVVAVTGTNGKTTVTRLIAHLAQAAGHHTGYTTTDGIYIDGTTIRLGDCSGPGGSATVLRDPLVDFAVLECARGGILRAGLGFDKCNISVVTNVTEDHLGLNDIDTIEQLARVKAVVPRSTFDTGTAILNADDDLVYQMKDTLTCSIALFSMDANNARIKKHCSEGGLAAFVEDNYFILRKGEWKTKIAAVNQVPLTFSGTCEFMIKNILPALLAASISNFPVETTAAALQSFIPSPELTPGRMNIFEFKNFRLMIDYVHNTDGYIQMKKFMEQVDAIKKTGIISATGDRRVEDIKNIGRYAALMFDEIIIRHGDNRGRTEEELSRLLSEGIREINSNVKVTIVSNEIESIQYAIDHAQRGEFIFVCVDDIQNTIAYVEQQIEKENTA